MKRSMSLFPPLAETIVGVGQALRAGRSSCEDVLQTCLSRIVEWDSEIHAWVLVDREGALNQARELDTELQAGRCRGPLHGIPVGIKDIVDVAGLPTAAGFRPWAERIAEDDATVVKRLREAGAVIVGKTVSTQFACFDPPATRNPWNLERTPGGSSSGSAAAVACGMCLGAIGSQTGGSITRPASFCGVTGCKPTYGRVSLAGIVPVAFHLDHPGPIARSVGDLGVLLEAISGFDEHDPFSVDQPSPAICESVAEFARIQPKPPRESSELLQIQLQEPLRLGRLGGLFDERAEPSAVDALERALETFRSAGATIHPVQLPETFETVLENHRIVITVELAAFHEERLKEHRDEYLPGIRSLIEEGLAVGVTDYARSLQHQAHLRREMGTCFQNADALVCPATIGPAPDRSTTGDPAFNAPWSYTGFPTVSFPIGLSPEGLPLGIQLVGRPFGEADLFRTAAWCEGVVAKMQALRDG